MKKILSVLIMSTLLSGCTFLGYSIGSPTTEPTMSEDEMSTRVAQILTSMPTVTQSILQVATKVSTSTEPAAETTSTAETAVTEAAAAGETPKPSQAPTNTPTVTSSPTATTTTTATVTNTAVPTIYPTGDPRASLGTADWSDPLNSGTNWPIDEDKYSIAKVQDGMLVFTGKQKINAWRLATGQLLTDAYIEVIFKTDTCSGSDGYGIYFRVPNIHQNDQGYLYGVTCDGKYYLQKWDGKVLPDGKMTNLVSPASNGNINSGSNKTNRLGVMAVGNRLMFYINGVLVSDATDTSYPTGYFGLFVRPQSTVPLTVRADEVNYWLNPTVP